MKYISTRHASSSSDAQQIPKLSFKDVVMNSTAPDDGLYVPYYVPMLYGYYTHGLSYVDLAHKIMTLYIDDIPSDDLLNILKTAYPTEPVILKRLSNITSNLFILEQFHGATNSFKDIAMQFLATTVDYIRKDKPITVLCATSGDTGSAVIHAFRNKKIPIYVLHPKNRISQDQLTQMNIKDKYVKNVAIDGTFDDCQTCVKTLLADKQLKHLNFLSTNSINWGRILAQIVYFFYAYDKLICTYNEDGDTVAHQQWNEDDREITFIVPTGNFGHALAGYYARAMGLPIRIVVATNSNDIIDRYFKSGIYAPCAVIQTLAPSMDIQQASNFERLQYHINLSVIPNINDIFLSNSTTDEDILKTILQTYNKYKYIVCPHTATAIHALNILAPAEIERNSTIVMSTASPSKFSDTIQKVIDFTPFRKHVEAGQLIYCNISNVKTVLFAKRVSD